MASHGERQLASALHAKVMECQSCVQHIQSATLRNEGPVTDDPVAIQVAAQNRVPFPVLTPNLSQRSAFYAKLFAGSTIASSGFIECQDTANCAQVRSACRKKCDTVLLTGSDYRFKYWNCVNNCAELHG